ncbi:MAG TPA: peptidylprolyl isomerase [Porphyromonadaceae bacterium]|nr:peptidylprolyl isomerase [Porphyromonadaceae bacterium]
MDEKLSYALGLTMGNSFFANGIKSLNMEEFTRAFTTGLHGEEADMNFNEATNLVNEHMKRLQLEAYRNNSLEGKDFLEENKKKEGVKVTPSGLQYEVIHTEPGRMPSKTDRVKVHYTGKLISGKVFDSSRDRDIPAVFGVTQVIPGWTEGLQLMSVGSIYRFYIPENLAYGERAMGTLIPPGSTLIFDVELLDIL